MLANGGTRKTIPCQVFDIITNIKKGVTTKDDECNPVGQSLSLLEARSTANNSSEEIV